MVDTELVLVMLRDVHETRDQKKMRAELLLWVVEAGLCMVNAALDLCGHSENIGLALWE